MAGMGGLAIAKAGPQDDALLQQVKQIASQGQSAQTTEQVNQYVDQNRDAITAILKNYMDYLKQLQEMSDDQPAATNQATATSATTAAQTPTQQQPAAPPATPAQTQSTAGLAMATLQTSSGPQTSGGVQTAHLAGYPALPDAPPVSAIQHPTVEQLVNGATVQKEMQDRKQYLEEHPEGYTYQVNN